MLPVSVPVLLSASAGAWVSRLPEPQGSHQVGLLRGHPGTLPIFITISARHPRPADPVSEHRLLHGEVRASSKAFTG